MRLLLDTNALLWTLANAPRIAPVREIQSIAESMRLVTGDAALSRYTPLVISI